MCTGILHLQSPQRPDGCQVSTPHRIWGPRLLPLQQPRSTDQVGLAIAVAIQAELDLPAQSPKPNRAVPPAHPALSTNPQTPRHPSDLRDATAAIQQAPDHSSRPVNQSNHIGPRHHVSGQTVTPRRPSLFTVSSSHGGWDSSCPRFSSSCFLCRRPLPTNKDIYMYRGDQAFCTKQCRHHQMVVDERKEKLALHSSAFITKNCRRDSWTTSHYYRGKEGIYT